MNMHTRALQIISTRLNSLTATVPDEGSENEMGANVQSDVIFELGSTDALVPNDTLNYGTRLVFRRGHSCGARIATGGDKWCGSQGAQSQCHGCRRKRTQADLLASHYR
jgi:hypothetical protein